MSVGIDDGAAIRRFRQRWSRRKQFEEQSKAHIRFHVHRPKIKLYYLYNTGGQAFEFSRTHTRNALPKLGEFAATIRSASIRAIRALSGKPIALAAAFKRSQNTGSRLIDVSCPAIVTDRLTGG
jgi:hypothetical protein